MDVHMDVHLDVRMEVHIDVQMDVHRTSIWTSIETSIGKSIWTSVWTSITKGLLYSGPFIQTHFSFAKTPPSFELGASRKLSVSALITLCLQQAKRLQLLP